MSVTTRLQTVAERRARGKASRVVTPRSSHARFTPSRDRPDPVAVLAAADATREQDLVPIRYQRMLASPFALFRGGAAIMAGDLAGTPTSGISSQLCGDAHLSNFGVFASPERTLLFDLNDFDQTLPGPWEWDVKRLAASAVIAGRGNGFSAAATRDAALAAARGYREVMTRFAEMRDLEVWYARVAADDVAALAKATKGVDTKATRAGLAKARKRDSLQALDKLTEVVDGQRRIRNDPPLLVRADVGADEAVARQAFADYVKTLEDDRRVLVERYSFVDLARKVVGVGSVGTLCLVVLLEGRDEGDPLFLQIKEAGPSVLERHLGRSRYANHGHRVVAGQRLMQAASDIFLGWIRGAGEAHRHFYWRQLRDMKGSADVTMMRPAGLALYAGVCGWVLARAHARSGDRIAIASYLGKGDVFERAVADFAETYADQNERDFETLTAAAKKGKVNVAG